MTRRGEVALERLTAAQGGAAAALTGVDAEAVLDLERATQDRPVGLALLLREAQEDGIVLLAREGGSAGLVVGFASARQLGDEMHVMRLAVAGSHRRRGIARRLLDALLDGAMTTDAGAVVLEVRAGNDAARALYAAAGFISDGLRPRYYPDGEDAVLLRRPLRTGANAPHGAAPSDGPAGGS